mgnify:CR=1 FL=1|jgi:hypothetical protein
MSRKDASFSQLYDYIVKGQSEGDEKYNNYHNTFSFNRDGIINEFNENSLLLNKRKNGNYLYHEIISLKSADGFSKEKQKEMLNDIVEKYIQERANNSLVFGGIHDEKDHNLHYHLMISANEINKNKRHRLNKKQFSDIKNNIENYTLERYPELKQEKIINNNKSSYSEKQNETEYKKRTGKTTKRESVKERLKTAFGKIKSKNEFDSGLESEGLKYYTRGDNIGFIDLSDGKKYRLKTLELSDEFKVLTSKLEEKTGVSKAQSDYKPYKETLKIKPELDKVSTVKSENSKSKSVKNKKSGKSHGK